MTRTAVVRGAAGVLIVALATALLVAAGSPASAGTVHRSAEAEMVAQITVRGRHTACPSWRSTHR